MNEPTHSDTFGRVPVPEQFIESAPALRLPPHLLDLSDNAEAIRYALLAIVPHFDRDGQILRQHATKVLTEQLDLENFIKSNPYYKDIGSTCSSLIKGLAKRGYISRWMCPMRKYNSRRATTKGYLLTPTGRQRYEQLTMPQPTAHVQVVPEPVALNKVANNINRLQPLLDQHEKHEREIHDYEAVLQELDARITKLKAERGEFASQLDEERRRLQRVQNEITAILSS